MNKADEILQKLDNLDLKIDRLLGYMLEIENKDAADDQRQRLEQSWDVTSTRVFEVDVENDQVSYGGPEKWTYRPGSSVQWISKTGKFTVKIQNNPELRSPFSGRRLIHSSKQPDGTWRTPVVPIEPIYSETEMLARTLAGKTMNREFRYVVAIEKGGEVFVDDEKTGTQC